MTWDIDKKELNQYSGAAGSCAESTYKSRHSWKDKCPLYGIDTEHILIGLFVVRQGLTVQPLLS